MSDIAITAASVLPSANGQLTRSRLAGATITAGQAVAIDTDGTVKLFDANGAVPLNVCAGIAVNGASAGQPIDYCYEDLTGFALGGTVAAGAIVIGSATPGGIAPAADNTTGWFTTVLGIGCGSNKIILRLIASGVAAA